MGKKSKGNRQTATNAPARQSPVASPSGSQPPERYANKPMRAAPRDPVIGESYRADAPKMRLEPLYRVDWRPTEPERADGVEEQRTDAPVALDSSQPYPQGHLGGKRWTSLGNAYMGDLRPTSVVTAERSIYDWWITSYGRERIERRMVERYGPIVGREAYQAVYLVNARGWPVWMVATILQRTAYWVARRCVDAQGIARS